MSIQEFVESNRQNLEELVELQNILVDIDNYSNDELKDYLEASTFLANSKSFRQLLYSIKFAIEWRPKNFDRYCSIFEMTLSHIKQYFTPDELCIEILTDNFIRYRLLELGLIDLSSIRKASSMSESSLMFFEPELNGVIDKKVNKLRHEGIHENPFFCAIRFDDLENFVDILKYSTYNLNMTVTYSKYEVCTIVNDFLRLPTLIEYAAFFGSLNIFKYLLMQKVNITERLPQFAAAGGNYDIIHIVEGIGCSFTKAMYYSYRFHQNEIVRYLHENHNIELTVIGFQTCVLFYNIDCFLYLLEEVKGFDINSIDRGMTLFMFASENGFLDIVEWLSKIPNININAYNEIKVTYYFSISNFGMPFV